MSTYPESFLGAVSPLEGTGRGSAEMYMPAGLGTAPSWGELLSRPALPGSCILLMPTAIGAPAWHGRATPVSFTVGASPWQRPWVGPFFD